MERYNDTTKAKRIRSRFVASLSRCFVKKKGFTLAEMLIVTIIIGILMTIGTRTYYTERNRVEFNNALIRVMGMIKTARNQAAASTSFYIDAPFNKSYIPVDGYGIFIDLNPAAGEPHFILFANIDPSSPSGADNLPNQYDFTAQAQADQIIESYRLPKQVDFHAFFFDETPGNGILVKEWDTTTDPENPSPGGTRQAVIIFKPPLADTFLGDNGTKVVEEVAMKFINLEAPAGASKACPTIRLNRIKTFPEIDYSNSLEDCVSPL